MLELDPNCNQLICGAGNFARSRLSGGSGRICTRPSKFLSTGSQPRLHRVLFYISPNTLELRIRSDQVIIALILPKWPMGAKEEIGLVSSKSLEGTQPFRGQHMRRRQKMNMIRHHDERMKLVAMQFAFPVPQRRHHHLCNFRPPQEQRTSGAGVQEPINRHERLACGFDSGWREYPARGKTAVQPEGDEEGLVDYVKMGQATLVMLHSWSSWWNSLGGGQSLAAAPFRRPSRLKAGCGQYCPPHNLYSEMAGVG